jgi:hypothetical protein
MLYRQLHWFQLIKDQSAFEGMFSCPTVASPKGVEGESDDNPIRLQGDSVAEMRALIGYLYSLCVSLRSVDGLYLYYFVCRPHEIQKALTDDDAFLGRCRLARIAHKYHFDSIEKWALDTIKSFWMSCDETSIPLLTETTNLASLCHDADLVGIVTDSWIHIVDAGTVSDIGLAIQIAEQHSLARVKGRAYYAMMILGRDVWERDGLLTAPQRMKLLSGFYDFVQIWNRFEKQDPPKITHSACTSTTQASQPSPPSPSVARCKSGWVHLWGMISTDPVVRDVLLSRSPADVIGNLSLVARALKHLHREMSESTTGRKMAAGCLKSASDMIKGLSEALTRDLPDMFVDPK